MQNDKIVAMLKAHEGVETHCYVDSRGLATIGVGRCIEKGSLGLSESEIDYLLTNDIDRVIRDLGSEYPWFSGLDEVRQAAMIDLAFNLGATRLRGFKKALEAMENEQYQDAAYHFLDSRWATQVGSRAKEVTAMIHTGMWQKDYS
jgi:lysozyme